MAPPLGGGRPGGGGRLGSPAAASSGLLADVRRALRVARGALDAELWGSSLLGMLASGDRDGWDDAGVAHSVLVELVEVSRSPEALALLRLLAAIAERPARSAAARAADRLAAAGVPDPPWGAMVGAPEVGPCWRLLDTRGSQESITMVFAYGPDRHAVTAVVDHSCGGGLKDCWVSEQLAGVVEPVAGPLVVGPSLVAEALPPNVARATLERALTRPGCPAHLEQVEALVMTRSLLRARVAILPRRPSALLRAVADLDEALP